MFWRKKPLTYPICVLPLRKPHDELSHEETETLFRWHQSVLPERIDCLCGVVSRELPVARDSLDLAPDSLLLIWRWFLTRYEIEDTPKESLDWFREHDKHPEPFRAELLKQREKQFSLQTHYILMDIGKYLGEVFRANLTGISWTYYEEPKSDIFVNKPVLQGFADRDFTPPFQMYFEPEHMAGVQAARIWTGRQKEEDLFNLYHLWKRRFWQEPPIPADAPQGPSGIT